jgi:hypothetical protein
MEQRESRTKRRNSSESGQNDSETEQNRPPKVPRRASPLGVSRIRSLNTWDSPEEGRSPEHQSSTPSLGQSRWDIFKKWQKEKFKYSPLADDEIRLLIIDPPELNKIPNSSDRIVVQLVHVKEEDLSNDSEREKAGWQWEYEALSYTWGGRESNHRIFVRTKPRQSVSSFHSAAEIALQQQTKKFWVRSNLYSALKCLRSPTDQVVLWVDAICIDQEDPKEQTSQIGKLPKIYSMAQRVCIWLGPEDDRTKVAMPFIKNVVTMKELANLVRPVNARKIGEAAGKWQEDARKWADLAHLMRRPWFSRRWIIQELALAREATVHCGSDVVHWDDMRDAISLFVKHFETIKELMKKTKELRREREESTEPIAVDTVGELEALGSKVLVDHSVNIFRKKSDGTIFEPAMRLEMLVSTLSSFNTSDPRDTINSLRNISREVPWMVGGSTFTKPPPIPDYTKNLLQVYMDFVGWVIETSHSLDLLCRHWALPEKEERIPISYPDLVVLPTWVKTVDESPYGVPEEGIEGRRKHGDSLVGLPGRNPYNASHGIEASATFNKAFDTPAGATLPRTGASAPSIPRDPSLYADGLEIDTITWVSDPIADGVVPKAAIEKCGWDADGLRRRSTKITKVPDRLWRTLVADRAPDGTPPPGWYHRACLHLLVFSTPNDHLNIKELLGITGPGIIKDYLKRVQAVVWNRRFLEADSGIRKLVGLCPPQTQVGDKVCILLGCSVPVILRETRDDCFEFIGEAFIYGKMDGEAISALQGNIKDRTKTFKIR